MADNQLPDGYATAIGDLVIATSRLDSILIDLLGLFAGTTVLATLISFSHMQTSSKIDTLLAFWDGQVGDVPEVDEWFVGNMRRARELYDFRSTVVHAYWTISDSGEISTVRFSARGKFKRQKTPVGAAEIQARTREVSEIEKTLRGFRDHLLKAQKPA